MLIILYSSTATERLMKLLLRKGINVKKTTPPKSLSEKGCSFGLLIEKSAYQSVANVANSNNIKLKGVYEKENDTYMKVGP